MALSSLRPFDEGRSVTSGPGLQAKSEPTRSISQSMRLRHPADPGRSLQAWRVAFRARLRQMASSHADAVQLAVQREQLRLLLGQTPMAVAATAGISGAMVAFIGPYVDPVPLVAWLLALAAVMLVRWVVYRRLLPRVEELASPLRWMRRYSILTFLTGAVWGAEAALYMNPREPVVFTMSLLGLAGMAAGAVGSLGAYPLAYLVFALPSAVMVILAFLQPGSFGWPGAVMAAVYYGANVSFLRSMHGSLVQAIRLRLDNEALVGAVTAEKESAVDARKVAEQAMVAKSQFLAAASHDLRQPVHALALFGAALEERAGNEQDVRRLSGLIGESSQALKSLLDGLLDISRLDAGNLAPTVVDVRLDGILAPLHHQFEPLAARKGLELRYVPTSLWARSDPAMLERIARNLVSNAIHYTERGKVLFGCHRGAEGIELRVYDTGRGIADDMLDEIFVEFRQLHNPERDRSKGMGLGLAIVRRLAALLDQPVFVRSVVGKGSLFALRMPYGEAQATPTTEEPERRGGTLVGRSLLLVDDEQSILTAMHFLLEGWGCRVHLATSGDEAEELATRGVSIDAMVVDYRLRAGETGPEAIRKVLAALGRPIPVLLITGDTAPDRIREAQSAGYPLLHKPLVASLLRKELEKAMDRQLLTTGA